MSDAKNSSQANDAIERLREKIVEDYIVQRLNAG